MLTERIFATLSSQLRTIGFYKNRPPKLVKSILVAKINRPFWARNASMASECLRCPSLPSRGMPLTPFDHLFRQNIYIPIFVSFDH